MSTEQMRHELMKLYGTNWQANVAVMSAKQVYTVYTRLLNKGIINPRRKN